MKIVMARACLFHPSVILLSLLLFYGTQSLVASAAPTRGFTVELFHSSSPALSSTYDGALAATINDTYKDDDAAENHRLSRSPYSSNATVANKNRRPFKSEVSLNRGGGYYLMKLAIGTPPVELVAQIDTGSDLIWSQCEPCLDCYQQTLPIIDSRRSSTYVAQKRYSKFCNFLDKEIRVHYETSVHCHYSYPYQDGSYTNGVISSETLTFDAMVGTRKVGISDVVFGCGHTNVGVFHEDAGGMVGLGRGPLSLVSQLGAEIGYKFSHCFNFYSEEGSTSKLKFGKDARFSGTGKIQRTPLAPSPTPEHVRWMYNLKLEDISVDNRMLRVPTDSIGQNNPQGGFFLDSSTPLIMLTPKIYARLESALKAAITHLQQTTPQSKFRLCYSMEESTSDFLDQSRFPTVTFHFDGGANWPLFLPHTFLQLKGEKDVLCSVFVPSEDEGISIFGNAAQRNFYVEYDLAENVVSFAPTDCTTG